MGKSYYETAAISSSGGSNGNPFILQGSAEEPKYVKGFQVVGATAGSILTIYLEREKIAEISVASAATLPYQLIIPVRRDLGDYKQLKIYNKPASGTTATTTTINIRYLILK